MARVLIVEDEQYIVSSLSFLLKRAGHEIHAVDDGRMAVGTVRQWDPDLVILDIMLPGMTGFDVLQALRRDEEKSETKVMVLTAKGQEQDRKRMRDLRADEFCTKPFSNQDLVDRVSRLVS